MRGLEALCIPGPGIDLDADDSKLIACSRAGCCLRHGQRQHRWKTKRLIDERRRSVRDEPEAFLFYISAFLSAARSVTLVLQKEEKQRYDAWFPKWFARRSKDERDLCNFMRDQRNVELHETGADVNLSSVSIPYIEIAAGEFGDPLYSFQSFGRHRQHAPNIERPAYHFGLLGTETEVTVACRRYFDLVAELMREFIRDHASPESP
jgi:hypothetical protein